MCFEWKILDALLPFKSDFGVEPDGEGRLASKKKNGLKSEFCSRVWLHIKIKNRYKNLELIDS